MITVPVSTHLQETAVLSAPPAKVWAVVSSGLSFWSAVESVELTSGASNQTLDATSRVVFKDGTKWTIQLREISGIKKSVSFEVISCDPSASVTSMIHTICVTKVSDNRPFRPHPRPSPWASPSPSPKPLTQGDHRPLVVLRRVDDGFLQRRDGRHRFGQLLQTP